MAKADWVKVSPGAGSGDASVNVLSNVFHTGRVVRTTIITWKAANVPDVQGTVNQAGTPEYVDIADAASADKGGKVVTISGVSNSSKLTFSLGTGNLAISLPENYNANSMQVANGAAIPGDPGASAEFPFSITINVPANNDDAAQSRQIIVTDAAGNRDVCLLTQAAGDAYITISASVIELDYMGTPVTIEVKSNTDWTIE